MREYWSYDGRKVELHSVVILAVQAARKALKHAPDKAKVCWGEVVGRPESRDGAPSCHRDRPRYSREPTADETWLAAYYSKTGHWTALFYDHEFYARGYCASFWLKTMDDEQRKRLFYGRVIARAVPREWDLEEVK